MIEIVNEPDYIFGVAEGDKKYSFEKILEALFRPSSIHGIKINGERVAIFSSAGGATGVHANSLVTVNGYSYLAVGQFIVCFRTNPFQFLWSTEIDSITCFGVYYSETKNALISHGETSIARFNELGNILWSSGGRDMFTGQLSLQDTHIEVFDFNNTKYNICYETGESKIV